METTYADDLADYYRCLSYHLGFCPDRIADAFKFDILSADQSLSRAAYADALLFAKQASKHGKQYTEWVLLLSVVDCALLDMESDGSHQKASLSFAQRIVALFSPKKPSAEYYDEDTSTRNSTNSNDGTSLYREFELLKAMLKSLIHNYHESFSSPSTKSRGSSMKEITLVYVEAKEVERKGKTN